ncbi:hypothetical protein [Streptomyces sp. ST2-7A]|uniref:DUF7848 domain-containing protein n=1 Tax=Streptomyces sp. ST2-7A TaxID=2907214 RepID=UPI001F3E49D1|nr:hypothetical protein [Streptomyces sp. ST2-7A]MCE7080904.1 hypothetical protein [Streptomyces sp. ST2-7A]
MFRFREYTIGPDREPDAETIGFTGQCAVCGCLGPTGEGGAHLTVFRETDPD